jgi:hypothetical protein
MDTNMLTTRVIGVEDISDDMASDMFGLYSRYYACADRGRFASDLKGKDRVIHLLDGNQLAGFTTLDRAPFDVSGQKGLVVFSGDTIVDRPHWGQTQLSYAWLREVAALSQRYEGLPVYWLLIVKGHRTFRFMPSLWKAVRAALGGAGGMIRRCCNCAMRWPASALVRRLIRAPGF